MDIYLQGRHIRLSPAQSLGQGGEAEVFALDANRAVKIFKGPDHADYQGNPATIEAARRRLETHQRKLPAFPKGLTDSVIAPLELGTDRSGRTIRGYAMRRLKDLELLSRYGDRSFRDGGIPAAQVTSVFQDLARTVSELHLHRVVIGDFNDRNILTDGGKAFLIDADSFQFDGFPCEVFTAEFLDPRLASDHGTALVPNAPFDQHSDWYAFAIMLFQSLLFVHPFGGLHRPGDPTARIPQYRRPLDRISVFHADVRYPRSALPLETLPDEWLQRFGHLFEGRIRDPWPVSLLQQVRWQRCPGCGLEHARSTCPACRTVVVPAPEQRTIRGNILVKPIYRARGILVEVSCHDGVLRWIESDSNGYLDEHGTRILSGKPDPTLKFRRRSRETLIGRGTSLARLSATIAPVQGVVERCEGVPQFDADERSAVWIQAGSLWEDAPVAPRLIGQVLSEQTRFWIGSTFGFGFYRAGGLWVPFVFARGGTLRDDLSLPRLPGELLSAECFLDNERCWFFTLTRGGGHTTASQHTIARCIVLRKDGMIEATLEESYPGTPWLSPSGGKCALGGCLLAATDDGLVRLEVSAGGIFETRRFPETAPFVHAGCRLLSAPEGLIVVDGPEIRRLQLLPDH